MFWFYSNCLIHFRLKQHLNIPLLTHWSSSIASCLPNTRFPFSLIQQHLGFYKWEMTINCTLIFLTHHFLVQWRLQSRLTKDILQKKFHEWVIDKYKSDMSLFSSEQVCCLLRWTRAVREYNVCLKHLW